ncbi:MAG: hypothetical protein ACR2H3_03445 [Acidimicrobiales bacterium]
MVSFDPVRIIHVLARHGVEFVVIGGFAAELYEAPIRRTHDVDVTPRTTQANLARLSAALDELGARIRTADVPEGLAFSHDASSLARGSVWNLTTTAGDFDLSFRPTGTDGYDDLAVGAVVIELGAYRVAVASLADVVRSKTAAGRAKDVAVLPELRKWMDTLKDATTHDLQERLRRALLRRGEADSAP